MSDANTATKSEPKRIPVMDLQVDIYPHLSHDYTYDLVWNPITQRFEIIPF